MKSSLQNTQQSAGSIVSVENISRIQPSSPLTLRCFHQTDRHHLLPGPLQSLPHWAPSSSTLASLSLLPSWVSGIGIFLKPKSDHIPPLLRALRDSRLPWRKNPKPHHGPQASAPPVTTILLSPFLLSSPPLSLSPSHTGYLTLPQTTQAQSHPRAFALALCPCSHTVLFPPPQHGLWNQVGFKSQPPTSYENWGNFFTFVSHL